MQNKLKICLKVYFDYLYICVNRVACWLHLLSHYLSASVLDKYLLLVCIHFLIISIECVIFINVESTQINILILSIIYINLFFHLCIMYPNTQAVIERVLFLNTIDILSCTLAVSRDVWISILVSSGVCCD